MICPYCSRVIHFTPTEKVRTYVNEPNLEHLEYQDVCNGIGVMEGFCPACRGFIVFLLRGNYDLRSNSLNPGEETVIYPPAYSAATLPAEIPDEYKKDYSEAYAVLKISAKASAALSRRLLQNILQNSYGISKNNLAEEIKEFTRLKDIPNYLANAVDAVRNIGNFAAHPLKEVNTGVVIDVEPDEAEWLIEVLEALLDYTFVLPVRLELQKLKLNAKLKSIGKPALR